MSRLMQLRLVAVLSLGAMQFGCNGETIKAPQPGATMHIEAASPTILTGTMGDIRPSTSTRLTHEIPDSPLDAYPNAYANPARRTTILSIRPLFDG